MPENAPFICIRLTGTNALSALHGQCTQDLSMALENQSPLALFCDRKGRVFGTVRVYQENKTTHLITASDQAMNLLNHIRPFLQLARVEANILEKPVALTMQSSESMKPGQLNESSEKILIGEHGNTLWTINDKKIKHDTEADCARLTAGFGFVREGSKNSLLPQQAHYQMLNGVSFTKGCYTGQEVIARLEHLGRVKKSLKILKTSKLIFPGDLIQSGSFNNLLVFDSQQTEKGSVALVLAPEDASSEELTNVPFSVSRQVAGQRPVKL